MANISWQYFEMADLSLTATIISEPKKVFSYAHSLWKWLQAAIKLFEKKGCTCEKPLSCV